MSFPLAFLLMLAGLIVSARTRMHAVLFGQPVSIPWLGLIFAVLILTLIVVALYLVKVLREEFRRQPVIKTVKWERA
jgi:uncharacterized Tic20 family protein